MKEIALELFIAKLLRYGVLSAGAVLAVGWGLQLCAGVPSIAVFTQYHSQPLQRALVDGLQHSDWGSLICYGGLTLLILLPLTRVAITALLFARRREYLMMLAALFVSITLILSFALGIDV